MRKLVFLSLFLTGKMFAGGGGYSSDDKLFFLMICLGFLAIAGIIHLGELLQRKWTNLVRKWENKEIHYAFPEIETPNLILREFEIQDAVALFQLFRQGQIVATPAFNPPPTLEETKGLIDTYIELLPQHKGIRWAVLEKESERIIGNCGFVHTDKLSGTIEIEYLLEAESWNNGLAEEALSSIARFGFEGYEEVDVQRVSFRHVVATSPDDLF